MNGKIDRRHGVDQILISEVKAIIEIVARQGPRSPDSNLAQMDFGGDR